MFIVQLISLCFVSVHCNLQCRNENNEPIDWYVIYKLPRIKESNDPLIKKGTGYVYITSDKVSSGWQLSQLSVNDSNSIPGQTLKPLYDHSKFKSYLWLLYNDQPPFGGSVESKGHTKGVIMSEGNVGFWLIHSVPHYPILPGSHTNYSYPSTGLHYGQSFLCISFDLKQLDSVGLQLMYNKPNIYGLNIPVAVQKLVPHLIAVAKNTTIKTAPWFNLIKLVSLKNTKFTSFAKDSHFQKDLYADWVTTVLQADLLVETWSNGEGRLPSDCSKPFKAINVKSVSMQAADVNFSSHLDHSKWAVSASNKKSLPWVCIGDINRMVSQEQRGGGTVCLNNNDLWSSYEKVVSSTESCSPTLSLLSMNKSKWNTSLSNILSLS